MGHLDRDSIGVPIMGGPQSNTPALDVERWGKPLCRVTLSDEPDAEEWNFALTDKTICLYHDDCENCKLIPRSNVAMVDLLDTDEIIVKVSKASYYMRKSLITLIVLAGLVLLDYTVGGVEGLGWLNALPETSVTMLESISPITNPWYLLFFLPFAPVIWALAGCCVPAPYADVFKGSKLHVMTAAGTTTFRMDDADIPAIQEFLDNPSGEYS